MKTYTMLSSLVVAAFLCLAADASPLLNKRGTCLTYTVDCESHHKVVATDTCQSLAKAYGFTVSFLLELNPGMSCSALPVGKNICHKARSIQTHTANGCSTTTTTTTTAHAPSCTIVEVGSCHGHHTLKSTDTCASLEKTYGLDQAHLLALNPGLNCKNLLAFGTRICHSGDFATKGSCTTGAHSTTTTPTAVPTGNTIALVQDVNNFCFFLPPPGSDKSISGHENDAVAFCTSKQPASPKALIFPTGFFTYKFFATGTKQGKYVQITGQINDTKYGLSPGDSGGQYDSDGSPPNAICSGYPYFVNLIEPDVHRFCIRCCKVKADCNFNRSKDGCPVVVPGNYGPGGNATVRHLDGGYHGTFDVPSNGTTGGHGRGHGHGRRRQKLTDAAKGRLTNTSRSLWLGN